VSWTGELRRGASVICKIVRRAADTAARSAGPGPSALLSGRVERRPDGPGTPAARPARPSLAELRAVAQPPGVLTRANAEHWAGLAYGRKISIHITRVLVPTRATPDGVTWAMLGCGVAGAVALSIPGLWTAALAAFLVQLQLVLDCSDGELARWRRRPGGGGPGSGPGSNRPGNNGASGIYLDRIGHYVTEGGLLAALGIRAAGGWTSLDGWATAGFAAAAVALLVKAETDLVHVARAQAGLPPYADRAAEISSAGLRGIKSAVRPVPVNRALVALEFSTLALLAALLDAGFAGTPATQALCATMLPLAAAVAGGHLLAIVLSDRLQAAPEPAG
jgi:hypothetical protein